jgi:hypothetical protein
MPRLQQRRRATAPLGCGSGTFPRLLRAEAVARSHDCRRGKGIASPDQPREPKQSWRPQGPTGLDVRDNDGAPSLLNPDSEQAGSRSCVGRDRTDGRRDLDQVAAARLGRSGHLIAAAISAAPFRRGCFTKVTDRKLFVIEPKERRSASRQINRADPAEALRSAPDAPVYAGSPSRSCLAPMPLVCETASVRSRSQRRGGRRTCSPIWMRKRRRRCPRGGWPLPHSGGPTVWPGLEGELLVLVKGRSVVKTPATPSKGQSEMLTRAGIERPISCPRDSPTRNTPKTRTGGAVGTTESGDGVERVQLAARVYIYGYPLVYNPARDRWVCEQHRVAPV